LWAAYQAARHGSVADPAPCLVFPGTRRKPRVSEQEARFFFVRAVEDMSLRYSVETPTTRAVYKQRGSKPSRASFDVTLRDGQGSPLTHGEFKSGGFGPKLKDKRVISKDVEKLLRDPGDGFWFHLLRSVNNATIKHVFSTLAHSLVNVLQHFREDIEPKWLAVHLCVLQHRFSLHKILRIDPTTSDRASLEKEFAVALRVGHGDIVRDLQDNNGWRTHRPVSN